MRGYIAKDFTAHWERRHLPLTPGILPFQEYDFYTELDGVGIAQSRTPFKVFLPRCQLDTIIALVQLVTKVMYLHQMYYKQQNFSSRQRGQHAAMDIPRSLIQFPHLPMCNRLAMRKSLTFRILLLQPSGQWVRKESRVEQAWWRAETSGPLSLNAFCTTEIARLQGHILPSPHLPHITHAHTHTL